MDENEKGNQGSGKRDFPLPFDLKHVFFFFWRLLRRELGELINIRRDADVEGTINEIKSGMVFKGINVWILAFSIVIASIGLNTNSTAVIIGAMLISPLMGPILGVGLGVATNDWATLKTSLKGFSIMLGISFLVSWIYFLVTPLNEVTSEILARTEPTLLDIVIAFAGGFAGIIAGSRKTKGNVIPGVAIATALMPPLCVAGYGAAIGSTKIFLGASYLFLLNCLCISISTFIIIKYLKFPVIHSVNPKMERKVRLYIFAFVLLVMVPSGFKMVDVVQKSSFENRVNEFINKEVKKLDYLKQTGVDIYYDHDPKEIDVFVRGTIKKTDEDHLKDELEEYGLKNVKLIVVDDMNENEFLERQKVEKDRERVMRELQVDNEKLRQENKEILYQQKNKIDSLQSFIHMVQADTMPFVQVEKEILTNYESIDMIQYADAIKKDSLGRKVTTPTFLISWKKNVYTKQKRKQEAKLSQWLSIRLKADTVVIHSLN